MQEIISFFKYLATSNVINFILMLIILSWILVKMNMKSSLEESVSGVEAVIHKSDEEKEKSEKVLKASKAAVDKLPDDIKFLEKEAASKAEVFKTEIEESAQKTIASIKKNVDRVISVEEDKISNLLKGRTIVASVETAKDDMKQLLKTRPELHAKFIEESLDELDRVKL